MPQLPSWLIMIALVVSLSWALWWFSHVREDVHLQISECDYDDPRERLKELEAAFAAGMMTAEELQRLAEKLGVDNVKPPSSGVSSKSLPKTWDDLRSQKSQNQHHTEP